MRGPQFLLLSFAWCGPSGIGQSRLPDANQKSGTVHTKRVEYNVPRIVDPHAWEHNRSSGKKVEAACLVLLARFGRYCTESGVDTLASGGVWTPSTFGPQRLDLWWPSC